MKKGGSFPFNQNAGRDFSFQNQKDPNFVAFSQPQSMSDFLTTEAMKNKIDMNRTE